MCEAQRKKGQKRNAVSGALPLSPPTFLKKVGQKTLNFGAVRKLMFALSFFRAVGRGLAPAVTIKSKTVGTQGPTVFFLALN